MLSNTKRDYNAVARTINKMLGFKGVTVIDTPDVDQYCDKISMWVADDLYDLLYERHDRNCSAIIFDNNFSVGEKDFYVEPYNGRLLNLAY